MPIEDPIKELEARLARVESEIFTKRDDAAAPTAEQLQDSVKNVESAVRENSSAQMSALASLASQIHLVFAAKDDHADTLRMSFDMMNSRVDKVDWLQDRIRETQREQTGMLRELLDKLTDHGTTP